MITIQTKLTTSGNSVAVRLPKELLRMSGLGNKVQLEAKKGKIIISTVENSRAHWGEQIKSLMAKGYDPSQEFDNSDVLSSDGLEDTPWNGPSFEDWLKNNGKLS